MSQPGVSRIEVRYPEGDAVLVYDGRRTSAEKVARAVEDARPDFEVTVQTDGPLDPGG